MVRLIVKASVMAVFAVCVAMGQSSRPAAKTPANFVGEWKVGVGMGSETFTITLDKDGKATKSHGSPNGHWVVFDDEARITWNDGWRDVIRKAGNHWEKAAFAPGKSFSDTPDNIAGATRTEPM